MKTYIAFVREKNGHSIVAIEAESKLDAFYAIGSIGYVLLMSDIKISDRNIDYVECEKLVNNY